MANNNNNNNNNDIVNNSQVSNNPALNMGANDNGNFMAPNGGIARTGFIQPFPNFSTEQAPGTNRYVPIPSPTDLRNRTLFGIPLKSALTNQELSDAAIQNFIDQSISEIEHTLDLYITPVTFQETYDYDRQLQFWSFGVVKVNHPNILNVSKFQLSFNNGFFGPPLVDIPLEFIYVQPLEPTLQLVPAVGVTISGLLISIYTGIGFHAFNTQTITNWPGAIHVEYTCGFAPGQVPAMLSGLIENMAAVKVLSALGPLIFPQNSVSISTDGVSQSTGTMGPAFLRQRVEELQNMVNTQMESAKGYYQRRFLIDYL